MHAIDKIVDSKLKTLSLAILKLTGLAEQAVREANVFDDDEFQVQKFWLLKIDHYKIINNFLKLKKNVFLSTELLIGYIVALIIPKFRI